MSHRLRSRPSILLTALLLLTAALPAAAVLVSSSPATAAPTLDHFQCYAAQSVPMPSGAPSFPATPPAVLMNKSPSATFLPTPGIVAGITHLTMHCNPVKKVVGSITTPISNPSAHLVCWALAPNATPLPTSPVQFHNQFGTGALQFKATVSLCLPSWKSLTPANLPPSTAPSGLDHFTCFSVVHLAGTPAFAPPASVTLTDQFFAHSTAVGAPNLLCSPTSKVIVPPTGTPIVNPDHYLVCFVIPVSPAFTSRVVYAKNQFGTGAVAVIANRELCVPSILG
jgi:hypothetical protein